MSREQQQFMNGLSSEQKTSVRNRTQEMQTSREEFERMLDALDTELEMESPDPARIRKQSHDMEAAVSRIQNRQKQMSYELGIDE